MAQSDETEKAATVVVGIGASAGGIEALQAFFGTGHDAIGAAFLVVMHLAPAKTSHLAEIIARHARMAVRLAAHGMLVESDTIYVLPPGKLMTVADNRLQITDIGVNERAPSTIDRCFNSLAETYGERAIGVVLSGTGADGTLGLKAIKDRGGLTVAQGENGSAPMFSGMPQSAIAAGVIDAQLPVEDMAGWLASIVGRLTLLSTEGSDDDGAQHREAVRQQICKLLQAQVGHDFSGYKPSTFFRRVERRMYVLQLSSLDAYVDCLRNTPTEASRLFRDLLISVTSFFRDTGPFRLLEEKIIPEIFKGKGSNDEVRVWVPGCATGEEAYSLGMLLLEYADALSGDIPHIRVFATDIDEHALNIARRGRYPTVLLDGIARERRKRFFHADQDHFTVHKRLREICTFSPHNALRDPPFSRIDLVSCRNLLIYLGAEFQDRILPIMHYALRPEGFLFVGVAEGATRHANLFEPVSRKHRIFRRLPSSPGNIALPLLARDGAISSPRRFSGGPNGASSQALRRQIEARILQAHVPPYVLVNRLGEALFYSGRTGNYLEFPPGAPSRHLLSNARKELRLGLRRALHDAIAGQVRVDMPEVTMPREDGARRVQVCIEPFEDGDTPLYLVLFNDHGPALERPEDIEATSARTREQMERELRENREQLQSIYEEFETAIEELRVANEELMSVNEELQSSNEELETSKEELQSVNEELQTVNSEMARHVEALDQSNADLRGLLESTGIATIFLDRRLAIRRYTRAATDIFTLIPSDCGRLITDLAHQLDDVDLHESLQLTLIKRRPLELAVRRKERGKHYLMCLLPYDGATEQTGGVVMTFVDVSALAEADRRHQTMIGELNHRVRNMLAVVSAMASQTMAATVPAGTLEAFLGRLHAMARTYKLLTETGWSHMSLSEMMREELGAIAGSARYALDGPVVQLSPREALALGMVVHELVINALKYGALSNDMGRIDIAWQFVAGPADSVRIVWTERGGPPVRPPTRKGFGTVMIERQLAYELDGRSRIEYAPDGLTAILLLPRLQPGGP